MPTVDLEQMPPDDQKALRAMVDAAYAHAAKVRADRSVSSIPDDELLRRVVRHVARNRPRRREFAWAAVSEAFALGSTFSAQLCRRFGLDPDTGADLKTPNVGVQRRPAPLDRDPQDGPGPSAATTGSASS